MTKTLYLAIGWIIVIVFGLTALVTLAALVNWIKISDFYLQKLFIALILEIVSAGFFLFRAGFGDKRVPYTGEWSGNIYWADDWAIELMDPDKTKNFVPVNPRAEGEVYIYCSSEGLYKCFATWSLKNNDEDFSKSAVLGNNFVFSEEKKLISFDFKAYARKILKEDDRMGPSPLYRVIVEEDLPHKLTAKMIIPQNNNRAVASLILERS